MVNPAAADTCAMPLIRINAAAETLPRSSPGAGPGLSLGLVLALVVVLLDCTSYDFRPAPRCPGRRRCRRRRCRGGGRGGAVRAASVRSRRVPVMPSGWPSAIAPPFTLTVSRSRPSSFSTARYCAANASLISKRSMSASVSPVLREQRADRRRRSHAHQRRLDADGRPRDEPSERREAARAHGLLRRDHERGAAVDDAAGVAGGDAAVSSRTRRAASRALRASCPAADDRPARTSSCPSATSMSTATTSSARRPSAHARDASCWLRSA